MIRVLLFPLLRIYDLVILTRNLLFDMGLFQVKRLDKPVISIGNLSMGGTGKSPITAELAGLLLQQGKRVAVLSRGYGRRHPDSTRQVSPETPWNLAGDEPAMIAKRHPEALVCVGPSRFEAAQAANEYDPDIYLIDDGFQHRQLHRDLDIVLVDVTQPIPHRISSHLFREHFPSLKRAQAVILTRVADSSNVSHWCKAIHKVNPDLPIFMTGFEPKTRLTIPQRHPQPLESLKDVPIAAFSGIAHPERFFNSLRDLGADLKYSLPLRDHQPLEGQHRNSFLQECRKKGLSKVLTTEKDAVKLVQALDSEIELSFLAIEVTWINKHDRRDLLNLIEKVSQ